MTTREVLVSPGFGAGWATWNVENGKALAEDPELIALVRAGGHLGETTGAQMIAEGITVDDGTWPTASERFPASIAFLRRAWEVCDKKTIPYVGGVWSLEIQTVQGPYRIDEYDGNEDIVEADSQVWW